MKIVPGGQNHREAHRLISGIIVPRPIAFVSTVGKDGVFNLAPFSTFTSISITPAIICFSIVPRRSGLKKDTLANIEFTKDFVINAVDEALGEKMNQTSADYPSCVDEFKEVGLTPARSDIVKAPRLAESPVSMECKLLQILQFGESPNGASLVIGEIVLLHIRDGLWVDEEIQNDALRAIGRLGGDLYCRTTDTFEMKRPPGGHD